MGDPVDSDRRAIYLSKLREASKAAIQASQANKITGKMSNSRREKLLTKQNERIDKYLIKRSHSESLLM